MTLETSVYTAFRGYAWSSVPFGLSIEKLNQFYRYVSTARGEFPDPLSVEVGLVSDGRTASVFTIQNVEKWDSEKRACDYAAFAFFSVRQAADIDFIALLNNDFFWTPSHAPLASLDYTGGPSAAAPFSIRQSLIAEQACLLDNPRTVGSVLSQYGARSSRWVCLMKAENILRVECDRWT